MQPILINQNGKTLFQDNPIVKYLWETSILEKDKIQAIGKQLGWTDEDFSHFAQLIGASIFQFNQLGCVSDNERIEANKQEKLLLEKKDE